MLVGRGKGREYFTGTEFQFCKIKNVLWVDGGDGCPATGMYSLPLDGTPKNGESGKLLCYLYFATI